jgi:transposase InsO family protein
MLSTDAKPIFHSNRGFQYTSPYFQSKLQIQGIVQSMSRVGRCIDNSPAEGLWGIIKAEVYYLHKFEDEKSLRSAIERYIHFYNYERFQERFGSQTPIPENKRIQKYKEKFAS